MLSYARNDILEIFTNRRYGLLHSLTSSVVVVIASWNCRTLDTMFAHVVRVVCALHRALFQVWTICRWVCITISLPNPSFFSHRPFYTIPPRVPLRPPCNGLLCGQQHTLQNRLNLHVTVAVCILLHSLVSLVWRQAELHSFFGENSPALFHYLLFLFTCFTIWRCTCTWNAPLHRPRAVLGRQRSCMLYNQGCVCARSFLSFFFLSSDLGIDSIYLYTPSRYCNKPDPA